MKKSSYFLSVVTGALMMVQASQAQQYEFHEIRSDISLWDSPFPYGLNDFAIAVMSTFAPGAQNSGPFYYVGGGQAFQMYYLPGDLIVALNNQGTVTGFNSTQAFVQDRKGNRTLIVGPTGDTLYPNGINDNGVVVGSDYDSSGNAFGFHFSNGTVTQYTYPGSTGSFLNAINDRGDIVGQYYLNNDTSTTYSFEVRKGKTTQIVIPNTSYNYPNAINDFGVVVGYATPSSGGSVGFVQKPDGTSTTLDFTKHAPIAFPGTKSPWVRQASSSPQTNLWGVNNLGQISGNAILGYGDGFHSTVICFPFIGNPF